MEALKLVPKGTRDISLTEYLQMCHFHTTFMSSFGSFSACLFYMYKDRESIAEIDGKVFSIDYSDTGIRKLHAEPWGCSIEDLKELAIDKIPFQASATYLDKYFELSSAFLFEDNYIYNWKELENYFTPEGGSSRQSRKIFNRISRETTKVVKHISELSEQDIEHILQVSDTWFKEFKNEASSYGSNRLQTFKRLSNTKYIEMSKSLPCYVNLFYQNEKMVAYDYLEIYPDVAIVPQGHSIIPSSWKYITWHLAETANRFGTKSTSLGSTKIVTGPVALGMSKRTDIGQLAEVKSQLPHQVEYINVKFNVNSVRLRTSKSTELF